jgi:hypothetical protein
MRLRVVRMQSGTTSRWLPTELRCSLPAYLLDQRLDGDLARAVNDREKTALVLCRPTLRAVDVKTDGISLEALLLRLVTIRLGQA